MRCLAPRHRGKRGIQKLTVEGFTELYDFVSLRHFLWDGGDEGVKYTSYLSLRRNAIESML